MADKHERSVGSHLPLEQLRLMRGKQRELREGEREAAAEQKDFEETLQIVRLDDSEKPKLSGSSQRVASGKHTANRQG